MRRISRALISVSDKTGVDEFARGLAALDVEIISTGGTARLLREASCRVRDVSDLTGFPEMLDGRVKTLHPKVHGGILAWRGKAEHQRQVAEHGIELIDLVVVNLYPFATTAAYDGAISTTLQKLAGEALPRNLHLNFRKIMDLRYGENPHQQAALYVDRAAGGRGLASARQLQGKELSFNNLVDLDAAWLLVSEFTEPTTAIIKHTNPCGIAAAATLAQSYQKALGVDPVSAFGSVIAVNRRMDASTAEEMAKLFVEAVAAPGFEPAALERLAAKKNLRLIDMSTAAGDERGLELKRIGGGLLVQTPDTLRAAPEEWKCVTERQPTETEKQSLVFAWRVVKHVKSNASVYARDSVAVGVGAGQMSRVDSVKLGAAKARELGHSIEGSVVASDAFFPFPDGVEEAAKAGATAIVQPGGSVRDAAVIATANRMGLAMMFTGVRHFRH